MSITLRSRGRGSPYRSNQNLRKDGLTLTREVSLRTIYGYVVPIDWSILYNIHGLAYKRGKSHDMCLIKVRIT